MEESKGPKEEVFTYKGGQYSSPRKRKAAAPETDAEEVLELLYAKLGKVDDCTKRLEEAAARKVQVDEDSLTAAENSLRLLLAAFKGIHSNLTGETAALMNGIDQAGGAIAYEVKNFKRWCGNWVRWFVLACGVAVLSLIGMVYFGFRTYKDSEERQQLLHECDSLRRRADDIYDISQTALQFASDNPKSFREWMKKKGKRN